MKRWRCIHCNFPHGFEFTAAQPVCPSCKKGGQLRIVDLTDVHWLGEMAGGPIFSQFAGECAIACMPRRPNVHGLHVSGEMTAVTCPRCRATPMFIAAWNLWAEMYPDLARVWADSQTLQLSLTT